MEIKPMDEELQEEIRKTVRLIIDLFDINNVNFKTGLNASISLMFTCMISSDVNQEDFETIMDELKQQYSKVYPL